MSLLYTNLFGCQPNNLTPGKPEVFGANWAVANFCGTLVLEWVIAKTATASKTSVAASGTSWIIGKFLYQFHHWSICYTSSKEVAVDVDASKELVLSKGLAVSDHDLSSILAHCTSSIERDSLAVGSLKLDLDPLELLCGLVKQVLDGLEVQLFGDHWGGLGSRSTLGQRVNPGHLLVAETTETIEA